MRGNPTPTTPIRGDRPAPSFGRRSLRAAGAVLATSLALMGAAACSDDDGSSTSTAPTVAASTDDAQILAAIDDYKVYVVGQTEELIEDTTPFTDAVREGDLATAQELYAPSRAAWERIEPIAGLIEEIDGTVDSRVDDFEGVDDPEFTGWHRLEYLLFVEETTDGAAPFADRLDADLETLNTEVQELEFPPATVALGASELVEEVSQGKITGEEDRYSKTDLWDFEANIVGAEAVIESLEPVLSERDPELLADIEAGFAEIDGSLDRFRDGDGFVLYCPENDEFPSDRCGGEVVVTQARVDEMKAQLAGLSEDLALVPGTVGLS